MKLLTRNLLILMIAAFSNATIAADTKLFGSVACLTGEDVVGLWIERSNGKGAWANVRSRRGASWIADYTIKFKNPKVFKKKKIDVRLHVGCGGTPSNWRHTLRTGSFSFTRQVWERGRDIGIAAVCNRKAGCGPWGEIVLIGMPFDGYWACPNGASKSFCDSPPASHPSVHHGKGDWTIDLYALQAPINVRAFGRSRDKLDLKVVRVEKACGNTGKTIETQVSLNGIRRGSLVFTHVQPNDDVAISGSTITGNDIIGWTEHWPRQERNCWNVSTSNGVHTHFAAVNARDPNDRRIGSNYSCYWDQDGSDRRRMTAELNEGTLIGILGQLSFSRHKQTACR